MRSRWFLALALVAALAAPGPGGEAAAQRSGRYHRSGGGYDGSRYRVSVNYGGRYREGRYDRYDRYDRHDRYDRYDRHDRYDRYGSTRRYSPSYRVVYREPYYRDSYYDDSYYYRNRYRDRYRYRRAGVLDVIVAVARAVESDNHYRHRSRRYRYDGW